MITAAPEAGFVARFAAPWTVARTARLLLGKQIVWPEARVASTTVDVDADAARAWLPPGLAPSQPARALVFVADYPRTSFGVAYREAGVLLCARRRGRDVLHCAWMVVDDDTALILGRELLGFPKKLARIELELDAETGAARARVERGGATLLALDATGAPGDGGAAPFGAPIVNVWGLPGPAPAVLLSMEVPQRVHAGAAARATLVVGSTAADPLARLIGSGTTAARVQVVDVGVPPAGRALPAILPVGLVPPWWLWSRYPARAW